MLPWLSRKHEHLITSPRSPSFLRNIRQKMHSTSVHRAGRILGFSKQLCPLAWRGNVFQQLPIGKAPVFPRGKTLMELIEESTKQQIILGAFSGKTLKAHFETYSLHFAHCRTKGGGLQSPYRHLTQMLSQRKTVTKKNKQSGMKCQARDHLTWLLYQTESSFWRTGSQMGHQR